MTPLPRGRKAGIYYPVRKDRVTRLCGMSDISQEEMAYKIGHNRSNYLWRVTSGVIKSMTFRDIIALCKLTGEIAENLLDKSRMSPELKRMWREEATK